MSNRKNTWLLIAAVVLTAPTASYADARHDKMRGNDANAAARATKIVTAADAPRPPTVPMVKSRAPELRATPGKKEITLIESQIYQMERTSATIWSFLNDESGTHQRELSYVAKQIVELNEKLSAAAAADPAWPRLPEYRTRIAYLQKAHVAQQAHYGALTTARTDAVQAVENKAAADWAAKRVTDDGQATALHKASVGKILVANQAIAPTANDAAAFSTTVPVEAALFARAYLTESPWNTMHRSNVDCGGAPEKIQEFSVITYYSINGAEDRKLEEQRVDKATFQRQTTFAITTSGSLTAGGDYQNTDEAKAPFAWLAGAVGALKPGNNQVKLSMYAWCYEAGGRGGQPIASTEFTVVATATKLADVAQRGRFKLAPSTFAAKELAPYLSKIIKAYAAADTVLDVRAQTSAQWQIVRNPYGVILERTANTIAVLRKTQTPWQCELVSIVLREAFDGRQYGPGTKLEQASVRPFVCNVKQQTNRRLGRCSRRRQPFHVQAVSLPT